MASRQEIADSLESDLNEGVARVGEQIHDLLEGDEFVTPDLRKNGLWGDSINDHKKAYEFRKVLREKIELIQSSLINEAIKRLGLNTIQGNNYSQQLWEIFFDHGVDEENVFKGLNKKSNQTSPGVMATMGWDTFIDVASVKLEGYPPPDVEQGFRDLLISKAQEGRKQYDEGELDMNRVAEYWKGDIWQNVTESQKKVAVYVYQDVSGSMRYPVSDTGELAKRLSEKDFKSLGNLEKWIVVNEVLQAFFKVASEAAEIGLPIRYAYYLWGSYQRPVKEIDESISYDDLTKRIQREQFTSDGSTDIMPTVHHYREIEPLPGETVIIIVLTDGMFTPEGYQLIRNSPTNFVHLWIPVGFTPSPETQDIMGDLPTHSRIEVYDSVLGKLKRILDGVLK